MGRLTWQTLCTSKYEAPFQSAYALSTEAMHAGCIAIYKSKSSCTTVSKLTRQSRDTTHAKADVTQLFNHVHSNINRSLGCLKKSGISLPSGFIKVPGKMPKSVGTLSGSISRILLIILGWGGCLGTIISPDIMPPFAAVGLVCENARHCDCLLLEKIVEDP
jgi:hypothetical protein